MNGWFLTLIILAALNVGINTAKHGKLREDRYSSRTSLIGALIQLFITYMAIYTGF